MGWEHNGHGGRGHSGGVRGPAHSDNHHRHHHHHHDHGRNASETALKWALVLTAAYMLAEAVGAYIFNSLALLSDAAHMMTDGFALAIALLAIRLGRKPADDRRTFGYRRFEILAAAFNALLLFGMAIFIFVEAIHRFRAPEPVAAFGMTVVAAAGLVVNLIAMRILSAGRHDSLNVKGAYLEVWADMIGSIGVIAAGLAIRGTGWVWIDPAVAILIALWVVPRTWALLQDSVHILLEGVPRGLHLNDVRNALGGVPGVAGVHALHIWSTADDDRHCTVHLALTNKAEADTVRIEAAAILSQRFGIARMAIQTEGANHYCGDSVCNLQDSLM